LFKRDAKRRSQDRQTVNAQHIIADITAECSNQQAASGGSDESKIRRAQMLDLANVQAPIETANGLPNACYIDAALYKHEQDTVFREKLGGDWVWQRCAAGWLCETGEFCRIATVSCSQ
jgi:hypothetical protein